MIIARFLCLFASVLFTSTAVDTCHFTTTKPVTFIDMCSFGSGRHVQDNNKTNDIMQKKREVTKMTTVSCHDSLCVTFAKHNNGQLHVVEH